MVLQLQHRGRDAHHVAQGVEGLVGEVGVADVEDAPGVVRQLAVAVDVTRRHGRDLGEDPLLVAYVVEGGAVLEVDPVEGIHRDHREVVLGPPPHRREELVEEVGGGDDGRTGVEGEAVAAEDGGATSGLLVGLDEGHPVAGGAEADRAGHAAEAGADDDCVGSLLGE